LVLLAAAIFGYGWLRGANHEQAKFAAFQAEVAAEGRASQKLADDRISREIARKVESDAKYKTADAARRSAADKLRDERARRNILPAPAADSASPGRACFDRAILSAALRDFDTGVARLLDEGDQVALRLKLAVEWAR
jgi:hypothetical protein